MSGRNVFGKNQLLAQFGLMADDQRASQVCSNPTRIIRWNGQDHNQRQIFSLPRSDFSHGIGRHIDMVAWMKQGWIQDHKGQRRFFDGLEPLEGGLGVMIKNDIPPLLRETKQTRRKRQDTFVADVK